MTDADLDPVLNRAIDELRELPPLDRHAVSRIVAAAAAARLTPVDDNFHARRSPRLLRWAWPFALAAAAAFAGFLVRGAITGSGTATPATAASKSTPTGVRVAVSSDVESRPVPHQFILDRPAAQRVALVADFNGWNPAATPLVRDPASGLWSVVVSVPPGRHVYGFMINDTLLTLDPRAPKAKDPVLGVEGSVVIVGKP